MCYNKMKGGAHMDINVIMQAVSSLGFPIVMCGAMAWYVKYQTDQNKKEMDKLNDKHAQEMKEFTNTVNNNTLALTRLCEKLDKE